MLYYIWGTQKKFWVMAIIGGVGGYVGGEGGGGLGGCGGSYINDIIKQIIL